MKIGDLEPGMIIKYHAGSGKYTYGLVVNNTRYVYVLMSDRCTYKRYADYDIPISKFDDIEGVVDYGNSTNGDLLVDLERGYSLLPKVYTKEVPKKELTVTQIEALLGYKIKVVADEAER